MTTIKINKSIATVEEFTLPPFFKTECHYYQCNKDNTLTQVFCYEECTSILKVHAEIVDTHVDDIQEIQKEEFMPRFNEAVSILLDNYDQAMLDQHGHEAGEFNV